ncbi:unnamed protein product, partial [Mesorhabditis belari]|uniref:Uncharacterized protein n=1 Tax=Mesorhabditis belari TaxID=2138241 RepID=A0AAF3FAD9_9BILA
MSSGEEGSKPVVCTFRKAGKKRAQTRQRAEEPKREDSDRSNDEDESVREIAAAKKRRQNPMIQSTKREKSKTARKVDASSSDDSEGGGVLPDLAFKSTGETLPMGPKDMGATATLEIDTDIANDAQSQFERVQKQLDEGLTKDGKTIYKGAAMYGARKAEDTIKGSASSGLNRIGPIRAPQFVRQTVLWDYKPDLCKDYKETGYCTFGDSCKFMHDRTDYKHGWEIDRDYEASLKQKKEEENYEISSEEEDNLPDECQICREPFVSPVVTKCKHYFCEGCAIEAFKKSKKCYVCNENFGGVFNPARDIMAKMAEAKPSSSKAGAKVNEKGDEEQEDQESSGPESEAGEELIEDTPMELLPDEPDDGEDEKEPEEGLQYDDRFEPDWDDRPKKKKVEEETPKVDDDQEASTDDGEEK